MLFIVWDGGFKVVHRLFPHQVFQDGVKLCSYLADDAEGVYLSNARLLLQHKVGHRGPVSVDKTVNKWKTE